MRCIPARSLPFSAFVSLTRLPTWFPASRLSHRDGCGLAQVCAPAFHPFASIRLIVDGWTSPQTLYPPPALFFAPPLPRVVHFPAASLTRVTLGSITRSLVMVFSFGGPCFAGLSFPRALVPASPWTPFQRHRTSLDRNSNKCVCVCVCPWPFWLKPKEVHETAAPGRCPCRLACGVLPLSPLSLPLSPSPAPCPLPLRWPPAGPSAASPLCTGSPPGSLRPAALFAVIAPTRRHTSSTSHATCYARPGVSRALLRAPLRTPLPTDLLPGGPMPLILFGCSSTWPGGRRRRRPRPRARCVCVCVCVCGW
jgi:hypothetical protein